MGLDELSGLILKPGHGKIPTLSNAILDIAERTLLSLMRPATPSLPGTAMTGRGQAMTRPTPEPRSRHSVLMVLR